MKTVKSLADATRMAAQLGGSLEVGGRVINSDGSKVQISKPAPSAPAPTVHDPTPEPKKPDPMAGLLDAIQAQSRSMAVQNEAMASIMSQIAERLPSPPAQKIRPRSFDVVRDDSDRIVSLSPVYETGAPTRSPVLDPVVGSGGLIESVSVRY